MKKTLLILLAMVMLAGCTTLGQPLTENQYKSILKAEAENLLKVGMSKEQVVSLIGEPQVIQKGMLGGCWSCEYWRYTSHGPSYHLIPFAVEHPLQLIFSKEGLLIKFRRITLI
jgi:outer membrane protein assembly factor BamE (lipoprotein component of BamABCDE complex)